jgi:hypothetical protein
MPVEDLVLEIGWRADLGVRHGDDGGGAVADTAVGGHEQIFIWRQGRAEVTLVRAENGWMVVYTSAGRLLGPRQKLYEGRHRRATHAAWDVMARVIRASRDEEEGMRVAKRAAQWMRALGLPDDTDD